MTKKYSTSPLALLLSISLPSYGFLSLRPANQSRLAGATFGAAIGALFGYKFYKEDLKKYRYNPQLEKKPGAWYRYLLKGAATGSMLGLATGQVHVWYEGARERIHRDAVHRRAFIKVNESDIQNLEAMGLDIKSKITNEDHVSAFDILEIDPVTATQEEVKKVYRKKSARFHPDKNLQNKVAANKAQAILNVANEIVKELVGQR